MKTKKILYSVLAFAMAAFTFTACEDVPEPYQIPTEAGGNGNSGVIEPAGEGSLESPFNVAAVIQYIQNCETLNDKVYIKGKVSQIKEVDAANFGNATFYISDDGTTNNQFYIYRCFSLNGAKFKSEDEIKVGDEVVIYGNVTIYNGTYETSANQAYIYSINGDTGGNGGTTGTASGDGTLANPLNSVAANQLAASLASGATSDKVYIKGKISSIKENFNSGFGNATFYISDDGSSSNEFYVFRTLYFNNQSYTSGDLLQVGDEVVIYGQVTNYMGNTYETAEKASYLYSLNGKTSSDDNGGDTPEPGQETGNGTLEDPYNSLAANNLASSLADGEQTDYVYIKGKVASIKENYNNSFGNATFYISDDGTSTNQFYVFRALYLNNEKYTSGDLLNEGDDVVVYAKLTNYMGNTPETVQGACYLYSLKSNGGSGSGGEVSGSSTTFTPSTLGLENGAEVGNVTLSDGTVITFDKGTNNNAPKYYNTGTNIRMYPTNSMTISATKKIASITIECDEVSGVVCNASGDVKANPGSVSCNDKTITVSGVNSTSTTITNTSGTTGAASQIRMVSMTINYAE